MKKILLALALVAFPAQAQVIGVMDSALHPNTKLSDIDLEVIDTGQNAPSADTKLGMAHGYATLKLIERELDGKKIKAIYASPFAVSSKGGNYMRIDWDRAIQNLETMKSKGVTMVCTTFVTNEQANATRFVEAANRLGIKIVASLGNGETATPFPAMHPDTIAVFRSDWADNSKYAVLAKRANYLETGKGNRKGGEVVMGSSNSAARVCGQIAKSF